MVSSFRWRVVRLNFKPVATFDDFVEELQLLQAQGAPVASLSFVRDEFNDVALNKVGRWLWWVGSGVVGGGGSFFLVVARIHAGRDMMLLLNNRIHSEVVQDVP